jgi:5,10-methylenetetrahydromethanopterin reductase
MNDTTSTGGTGGVGGITISCGFPPSLGAVEHIVLAEQLGFRRAWLYDSPALYPDVWMILGLAAQRATRIGLGPGVLVPSLRHPMVNAAAIAALAEQAPGRVSVAIGCGFTGRMVLGQRPMRWRDVEEYVRTVRALLRGDDAQWEGATLRMVHPAGYGAPRPVTDVPFLIAADGPKGLEVAAKIGDGVFSAGVPQAGGDDTPPWRALLAFGTVLDEGEDPSSSRARAATAPAFAVVAHALYERAGAAGVTGLPGGEAWVAATEAVPKPERHLAIHEGHLVQANARDELLGDVSSLVEAFTFTGAPAALQERLRTLAGQGVTEIAYQPAGPDIERELRAFAAMAGL